MKVVYVAGLYRAYLDSTKEEHIARASIAAQKLWKAGYAVICPHLNSAHFEDSMHVPDELWLDGYLEILSRCDAIFMLKHWRSSEGATAERDKATKLGMQIIYEV